MRPWVAEWAHRALVAIQHLIVTLARHSGIPAVLVAAVALVLAATHAGWLKF
jgi:hypothetical protein